MDVGLSTNQFGRTDSVGKMENQGSIYLRAVFKHRLARPVEPIQLAKWKIRVSSTLGLFSGISLVRLVEPVRLAKWKIRVPSTFGCFQEPVWLVWLNRFGWQNGKSGFTGSTIGSDPWSKSFEPIGTGSWPALSGSTDRHRCYDLHRSFSVVEALSPFIIVRVQKVRLSILMASLLPCL